MQQIISVEFKKSKTNFFKTRIDLKKEKKTISFKVDKKKNAVFNGYQSSDKFIY
jgi:hypothetical protein